MKIPLDLALIVFALTVAAFVVALTIKQMRIDHLQEQIRLHLTNGGRVRVSQEEAATITAQLQLRGSDLVKAIRLEDYRQLRSS